MGFFWLIYYFDTVVSPTIMAVSEAEMRAKSIEIINKTILEELSREFNYDEIIKIDKDNEGNIVMLKANTLKLNKIACDVALKSQEKLNQIGALGIKLPIGYITKNNILSYFGPSITVKMEPLGHIETCYSSQFQGVGINQTRHRIFIKLKAKVRIIIPTESSDIEISSEIPISETILIGKVPENILGLDLKGAGYNFNGSHIN